MRWIAWLGMVLIVAGALPSAAVGASASIQVSSLYGGDAIYEDQAFNAVVSVTPAAGGYDASRFFGSVSYVNTSGATVGIGSAFAYAPGSSWGLSMGSLVELSGIPEAGTYELKFEGLVEHLGYFEYGNSQAVWGRPENFTTTITVTIYEQPLGDSNAALSNTDNASDGQLGLGNASYNNNSFDSRTIESEIHQSFTTGTQQTFLDRLTIRDRESADAPVYYVKLLGPSTDRLLERGQKVGKYYTEYVPTDGVLILQPNTKYRIVMEPYVVPPFSATFDATSDQLGYRSSLGWVAGETLLVTKDSGGYQNDGGYEPIYVPPSTTSTISAASPLFSISATPTGGYDGFVLAGAATKLPFDTSTAAKWSAGGAAWTVDTSVTRDGVDSVKAQTSDGQSTYREYAVTGPAIVEFWWKVSSERNFDTLSYSVNGANEETISGEVDWTYRTLTLPAGSHTIRWTYTKDGSDAVGQDAGWLDDFAVYPATATLQVRDGAKVLSGTTTVDFGSVDLGSSGVTKTLAFANEGFVPLELQLSLPEGSPFTFVGGESTFPMTLEGGQSADVEIFLDTASAGIQSAELSIAAPDSTTAPPSITFTGYVGDQQIAVTAGGVRLVSGETFDMGLAPQTTEFTITNDGLVDDLIMRGLSIDGGIFQILPVFLAPIPPGGSLKVRIFSQAMSQGVQSATLRIMSNAANMETFIIPLTSKALFAGIEDITSLRSFGEDGAAGWDFGPTALPDGTTGDALKTGATPDSGQSHLQVTFGNAGLLTYKWKLSAQEGFDWLACEVGGGNTYRDTVGDVEALSANGALDIIDVKVSENAFDLVFTLTVNGDIALMQDTSAGFFIAIANGKSAGISSGNTFPKSISLSSPIGGMTHWVNSWVSNATLDGRRGIQLLYYDGVQWRNSPSGVWFDVTTGARSVLQYSVSKASLNFEDGDVIYFDVYSGLELSTTTAFDALSNPQPLATAGGAPYLSSLTTGISRYPRSGEVASISTKNAVWREQAVYVPANGTVKWTYRKDGSAAVGEDAGYITDLSFQPFTTTQTTYEDWWALFGKPVPPSLKTPMAMSGLPAIMSWVGGFDPDTAPDAGLYRFLKEGGQWKFRFPISKTYGGGSVSAEFSYDLTNGWSGAGVKQTLHSQDADTVIIEATPPAGATKGFMRLNVR